MIITLPVSLSRDRKAVKSNSRYLFTIIIFLESSTKGTFLSLNCTCAQVVICLCCFQACEFYKQKKKKSTVWVGRIVAPLEYLFVKQQQTRLPGPSKALLTSKTLHSIQLIFSAKSGGSVCCGVCCGFAVCVVVSRCVLCVVVCVVVCVVTACM